MVGRSVLALDLSEVINNVVIHCHQEGNNGQHEVIVVVVS
jgi:anti-sigma regulatory factor (Ser/Thr protein kinase)